MQVFLRYDIILTQNILLTNFIYYEEKIYSVLLDTLDVIGGVKLNVLNAQETKTIGSGNENSRVPVNTYYEYSIAQQIFTKDEINASKGEITKIAFNQASTYVDTRSWDIYMMNTDKSSFAGNTDWVSFSNVDLVYSGNIARTGSGWLEIELQNKFMYNGENMILCVYDKTGSSQTFNFKADVASNKTLKYDSYYSITADAAVLNEGYGAIYDYKNQFRFTIEAADDLEPATPTNLVAEAESSSSVKLTWDAAENAKSYNIYKGDEKIGSTSGTSYTVTGLEAEADYCFTVTGVRFDKESASSNSACATTPEIVYAKVDFVLTDSSGDGWDGGAYLTVKYGSNSHDISVYSGATATYTYNIAASTKVEVTFHGGSYYDYECSYCVYVDDTKFFCKGNENSEFIVPMPTPKPQNLIVIDNKTQLYPGETTKISWDAFEGAVSYNVYVNDEKIDNTIATEYELTDLPYGINEPNSIAVSAVFSDESESGKSTAVSIQMAGDFTLVLNVKDNAGNPIASADVKIEGYDEYGASIYEEYISNAEGQVETTLYLPYPGYNHVIEANKKPYIRSSAIISAYDVTNEGTVTLDITLKLPGVNVVYTDKDYYEENEAIILSWDAVDNAKYNVYVNDEVNPRNAEPLTSTVFTIEEGLAYSLEGNEVFVTAVYDLGESDKGWGTSVNVNGYGTILGVVTDGTNPIASASVVLVGQDDTYQNKTFTFTTAADGTFNGKVSYNNDYTNYKATISKFGYKEQTIDDITVTFESNAYDFGTITLTAFDAEATITNITATVNDNKVDVSWEAEYERYNVYRKDAEENVEKIGAVMSTSCADESWMILANGEYTYGVSTFVDGGVGSLFGVEDFSDGMPSGWIGEEGNVYIYNDDYVFFNWDSSNGNHYLILPYQINPEGYTLSFNYINQPWNSYQDQFVVCYSTTAEAGNWVEYKLLDRISDWTEASVDLSDIEEDLVYIAICQKAQNSNGSGIDDVELYGPLMIESAIIWAENVLVKNDANVYEGIGEWTSETNWNNGVPASGANVFINGDVTITSNVNVNNMTINGGSVTIDNGASLTVEGALVNEAAENLVINDGGQILQSNEGVPATFVMGIAKASSWGAGNDGWQFISSPFTNASIYDFINVEGDYDLFKYNGYEDLEWVNYKGHAGTFGSTFQECVAYLASYETATSFEMTGTLNHEDSFKQQWYGYSEEDYFLNLQLIGNPFPFDMDWSKVTTTGFELGYAEVNANGSFKYSTEGTIDVGNGFFAMTSDYDNSFAYNVTRNRNTATQNVSIVVSGRAGDDNVVINFAGRDNRGFAKLENFNTAIANVYVVDKGRHYGIYNCDTDTQEVELSFDAKEMGSYTINAIDNGKFNSVILVDRMTGVETDLLVEGYTFTATSNDNTDRFIVKFADKKQSEVSSSFVYQSGEELIINAEGTVQIIDVMGRMVYSNDVTNDNNRISVSELNNAAYIVRLINAEGVKVQKVVIY